MFDLPEFQRAVNYLCTLETNDTDAMDPTQRNSAFQNNCFQEKKDDKRRGGYCVGSFSEAEVNKIKEWNVDSIKKRGIMMLEFMEKRWNFSIDDKLALLHLKNIQ